MEITIETTVKAPLASVWRAWTTPVDITHWNFASDDWHCPAAQVDLRPGGRFSHRMEARDGSIGFDLEGEFTEVREQELIRFALEDGRQVEVRFEDLGDAVRVSETFTTEDTHTTEQQREGWQSILENFRKHVEAGEPAA